MEIGDLLYVLIMVVALVFSVLKKAKGKEQRGTVTPDHEVDDSLSEIFPTLKQIWEEQKVPEYPITPTPFSSYVNQKENREKIKKRIRIKDRKTITSSLKKRTAQKVFLDEDENEGISYWNKEPIDLRKAVIYSEILKRPDY